MAVRNTVEIARRTEQVIFTVTDKLRSNFDEKLFKEFASLLKTYESLLKNPLVSKGIEQGYERAKKAAARRKEKHGQ